MADITIMASTNKMVNYFHVMANNRKVTNIEILPDADKTVNYFYAGH